MDESEDGPCKAGKEEVQRYIRIKLKDGAVIKAAPGYWSGRRSAPPNETLLAHIQTSGHRRPCVCPTGAPLHCRHRPRHSHHKVTGSGFIAPCYSPRTTPSGFEGRDAPSPHNPYHLSHSNCHRGESWWRGKTNIISVPTGVGCITRPDGRKVIVKERRNVQRTGKWHSHMDLV